MARDWLLITVSTPGGGTSTLRVFAWRKLRSPGAHYLQQSVCLLPATPATTRATAKLVTRLRAEDGHGEILRIQLLAECGRADQVAEQDGQVPAFGPG